MGPRRFGPRRALVLGAVALVLGGLAACSGGSSRPLSELRARSVDFDGVSVRWKESGSGEPSMIFVPGWASDMRVFAGQAEIPPTNGRMIFLDLPGHGESDAPERDYSFSWLAGAIESVREAAGADRVVLFAHSNGAALAREYLRQHPDRVTAFVSVEGSFRPVVSEPRLWDRLVARFRQTDYGESVGAMLAPDLDPALRQELFDMMMSTPQHVMVSTLLAYGESASAAAGTIDVPLIALHAPSRFWTDEYRRWLEGVAPRLEWKERAGTSHFLMREDPAWVAETVKEFLASVEAGS